MIELIKRGAVIKDGVPVICDCCDDFSREKTMAYKILRAHDKSKGGDMMNISFDAMVSHDIT